MSISNQSALVGPVIGASYPFNITVFPFQQASDLQVINIGQTGATIDPPTVLSLNSDYTVTGGGYDSDNNMLPGTVTVVSSGAHVPAVNDQFYVLRNVPLTSIISFLNTGNLTARMIEQGLDKLTTIAQEQGQAITTSLRLESWEDIDTVLLKSQRSGNVLAFDANGNVIYVPQTSIAGDASSETVTSTGSTTARSLANRFITPTNACDFGASTVATGSTNTAAIQAALNHVALGGLGGVVTLDHGGYNLAGTIRIPANVTLSIYGVVLIQQTANTGCVVIDSVDFACLFGCVLQPNNGPGVFVDASTADCTRFVIRDVFVFNLRASGIGIDLAGTSALHNIGFGQLDNCRVWGDVGASYGTTIGMRFGTPVGAGQLNGVTVNGGRIWNLNQGLDFRNCSGVNVSGISLDDMQGGSSIGIHFEAGAQYNQIFGVRWENGTYTKSVQFDSTTNDNFIYPLQAAVTSGQWTDSGVRNSWLGGDGSGGVANKIPNPVNFTGNQTYGGTLNGLTILNGSGTTPQVNAPANDSTVPNWFLGGTSNGTGSGGSTITHNFLFPFNGTYPQMYLASCAMVSSAGSANYAQRTSLFTETISGTFAEANLGYVHPGAATLTFSFSRSSNDVLFGAVLTTNDGGTANTTRNLIRLN